MSDKPPAQPPVQPPAPEPPKHWLIAHKELVVVVLTFATTLAGAFLTPFFQTVFEGDQSAATPTTSEPVVSRVSLMVHNPYGQDQPGGQYYVRCPLTVKLSGMISVSEGSGTMAYEFVRKEGLSGREEPVGGIKQVVFSEPGTK